MRLMTVPDADLIAGLATPLGRSGVAVVRLSGPNLPQAVLPLLRHPDGSFPSADRFKPRCLHRLDLLDLEEKTLLDQALVVWFPAPHSFTGEPQLEIQCHGSPVVVDRLLALLTRLGVRMARPGEFSRRAHQNGRLGLTQAEALMTLIHASTVRVAREAARQMQGSLAEQVTTIRTALLEVLAQVEADLDFADEEIDPADDAGLRQRLLDLTGQLSRLVTGGLVGRQWQDGWDLVIAGQPNVGKSTLFNRLVGREKAIVTPLPGTTRDLNEHSLEWSGIPVLLVDTAGLRHSDEVVEQEGIRRARARIAQADGVIWVYDARIGLTDEDRELLRELGTERLLWVANKVDLCPDGGVWQVPSLPVSCLTGEGLEGLREAIERQFAREPGGEEGGILLHARHREVVQRTEGLVQDAVDLLNRGVPKEIIALTVRSALEVIGEMAGETTHIDLLDRIFSQFCIGK